MAVNDVQARTHCRALNTLLTLAADFIYVVVG